MNSDASLAPRAPRTPIVIGAFESGEEARAHRDRHPVHRDIWNAPPNGCPPTGALVEVIPHARDAQKNR